MSDLAFDANGEPFELPATAAFWRVRRFRNVGSRGAPEVVFGRDGLPLILPIEIELGEFRDQVEGMPGRYRLDPIDERHRAVGDVPAAYIQISEPLRTPPASGAEEHATVTRELARANADMVKTIADKFAAVMQSAADLLRAADGAGLPARAAPVAQTRNAGADDGDEEDEEPRSELAEIIKQAMPLVQLAVTKMLNGRGGEARNAAAPAAGGSRPSHGGGPEGASGGAGPIGACVAVESRGAERAGSEVARAQEKDLAAHLGHVEAALTPAEVQMVRRAMGQMTPEVLQAWAAKLCGLSVEEAVKVVRAEIGTGGAA